MPSVSGILEDFLLPAQRRTPFHRDLLAIGMSYAESVANLKSRYADVPWIRRGLVDLTPRSSHFYGGGDLRPVLQDSNAPQVPNTDGRSWKWDAECHQGRRPRNHIFHGMEFHHDGT